MAVPILIFEFLGMEEQDLDYAIHFPGRKLDQEGCQVRCKALQATPNKWCRDFVTISIHDHHLYWLITVEVDFLHSTVRDSLKSGQIREFLREHSPKGFDHRRSLCRGYLYCTRWTT